MFLDLIDQLDNFSFDKLSFVLFKLALFIIFVVFLFRFVKKKLSE